MVENTITKIKIKYVASNKIILQNPKSGSKSIWPPPPNQRKCRKKRRRRKASKMEKTFVMIKPDGVQRRLVRFLLVLMCFGYFALFFALLDKDYIYVSDA